MNRLSHNQIKFIRSLHLKKFRRQEKAFIVEGEKAVHELLQSGWKVSTLFATAEYLSSVSPVMRSKLNCREVSVSDLERVSALNTPHEALAVACMPDIRYDWDLISGRLKLVLDTVQDPGNLGTLIRIAHWFGIREIICSENTVDCFNPKVVQATMGSLFHVTMHYLSLETFFLRNRKEWHQPVYGSLLTGTPVYSAKLEDKGFLLMGNESEGISHNLQPFVTHKLTIPPFTRDGQYAPDSLNVAVAAGIICSEFRRQNPEMI